MHIYHFINKVAVLAIAITMALPAVAQQEKIKDAPIIEPQNAISFVPQYAIFNGIRMDYERRIKNSDHWLVFAPMIFMDSYNRNYYYYDNSSYTSYQSMAGVGINLYYKSIVYKSNQINIKSGLPRQSIYFSAGPNYQYFSLSNSEEVAVPFVENGITYYEFELQDVKKPIHRFGAVADVGWQLAFDRFLLDLYLGVAIKYSTGKGGVIIQNYNSQWTKLDYSGILLDGGLRIGMFF